MSEVENRVRVFRPTHTQAHFLTDIRTPIIHYMSAVNQGKSASVPAKLMYSAQIQHPDVNGYRHTSFAILRGTQSQLLDTTVKSVREWFSDELMHIRKSQPIEGRIREMAVNDHLKRSDGQYPKFPLTMRYKDNLGQEVEGPYLLGATKNPDTGIYEAGQDVSGAEVAEIFTNGTHINSDWRFMAIDSQDWEGDLLSTNFGACAIDEADQIEDLEKKLPVIDGRLGRYPSADIAPCTVKQISMCYNPPEYGTYLEKCVRPGQEEKGHKLYRMPAPIKKIDNPEDPDCFVTCKYVANPDAEGLHFATEGAAFWLDKADKFSSDSYYITRSLLGEYPQIGGGGKRIYTAFNPTKHIHSLKPSYNLKLVASLDHANSPCMVVGQWDGGLRIIDELYDDDMLSVKFARDEAIPYLKSKYGNYDTIITGDPTGSTVLGASEFSIFDVYTMEGGYTTVENLTNDKELRWDAVNYYLGQEGGFVIDPRCERLIEGFKGGYVFDGNAAKRGQRKAQKTGPHGKFSHLQDALQALALYFRGSHEYRAENLRNGGSRYEDDTTDNYLIV